MLKFDHYLHQYLLRHQLSHLEGNCHTEIEGVSIYRSTRGHERQPLLYQSGIIALAAGRKTVFGGGQRFQYSANDYLVVGVPLPLECEAVCDGEQALMGIAVNFTRARLMRCVSRLEQLGFCAPAKQKDPLCGLHCRAKDGEINEILLRIAKTLNHPLTAQLIGEALVDELLYQVLMHESGAALINLARQEGKASKIARSLDYIHRHYAEPLTVNFLAQEVGMSVSAFHTAFKSVTFLPPLQYLKQVRLNKAKELIQLQGKRVSEAAVLVGYQSSSQFSREFKRQFAHTPGAMAEREYPVAS
ncbi:MULTISPECIES: AraC family transcriptional regulator [unclassified Vibrio]|uniref:AraC family transcriptional regulator N-terminal domain-containing protein n=1 Tax=Vibrio sp. HB236076 TaxID=3232307 RepID=A0AB39HFQ8_9VIBR|nr:AraC family transcriptional regulator [Vibrio sp. HB161653]MDP5253046.1 AraC family transcriptional regulator [Vibrio sp. HB161653]